MNTKHFSMGLATALLLAISSAASAATFSFTGTGQTRDVNFLADSTGETNDNDLGLGLGVQTVDIITGNFKDATNGLSIVGGPTNVKFTYLGFEAGNSNFSASSGVTMFENGVSVVGEIANYFGTDGLVDLSFGTTDPELAVGEFKNNGGADPDSFLYAMGYLKISDTSYYVFFDDIAFSNRDFDDIAVRIDLEPIPLPAGILLMGTALAGFGVMRRRKKQS